MSQVRKQLETFRKFPSKTALWRGNRSHKESILHFDCGARYVMTSSTSHASLGATKTRWRTSCSSKELVKDGRFWRQLLRKKQSKQSRIKYQLEDFWDSICLLRNPFKVKLVVNGWTIIFRIKFWKMSVCANKNLCL